MQRTDPGHGKYLNKSPDERFWRKPPLGSISKRNFDTIFLLHPRGACICARWVELLARLRLPLGSAGCLQWGAGRGCTLERGRVLNHNTPCVVTVPGTGFTER
jgi:hypothetical protein